MGFLFVLHLFLHRAEFSFIARLPLFRGRMPLATTVNMHSCRDALMLGSAWPRLGLLSLFKHLDSYSDLLNFLKNFLCESVPFICAAISSFL